VICILVAAFFVGCGPVNGGTTEWSRDWSLQDYVYRFLEDAEEHGASDRMIQGRQIRNLNHWTKADFFASGNEKKIGLCVRHQYGDVDVYQDIYIREGMPEWAERVTMYHELGHCWLGLEHAPEMGRIMSAGITWNEEYWDEHWEEELELLFSGED
jgi:hypothetical protein